MIFNKNTLAGLLACLDREVLDSWAAHDGISGLSSIITPICPMPPVLEIEFVKPSYGFLELDVGKREVLTYLLRYLLG